MPTTNPSPGGTPMSFCQICGRKRPTYAMKDENDEIVFLCGECCAYRVID